MARQNCLWMEALRSVGIAHVDHITSRDAYTSRGGTPGTAPVQFSRRLQVLRKCAILDNTTCTATKRTYKYVTDAFMLCFVMMVARSPNQHAWWIRNVRACTCVMDYQCGSMMSTDCQCSSMTSMDCHCASMLLDTGESNDIRCVSKAKQVR